MNTYVSLLRFTEKGAAQITDSANRAESFDAAAKAAGVEIVAQYWTIGAYDGILIVRADSEAKALHWLAELNSKGNVRTESMQAFTAEEFRTIVS